MSLDADRFKAIRQAVNQHLETGGRVGVYVTRHGSVFVCDESVRYVKSMGVPVSAEKLGVAWNGAFYFKPEEVK